MKIECEVSSLRSRRTEDGTENRDEILGGIVADLQLALSEVAKLMPGENGGRPGLASTVVTD